MLKREVGIFGAMMMGLGSIIGTGVFVSIGIASGVTGPAVVFAIAAAAVVATFNGLSSAQLAASHPVSGGTYEYGYRWLRPSLGFTAGWLFLCAKSTSAATAALGFAGYTLHLMKLPLFWAVPLAMLTVGLMTILVLSGLRRSNFFNTIIVVITVVSLGCFVVLAIPAATRNAGENLQPLFAPATGRAWPTAFLESCALMFVAFTGYGRIATLGEEVINPRQTIPKAIVLTLVVSSLIYVAVGAFGIAAVGADVFADASRQQAAPLQIAAIRLGSPAIGKVVAVGAMTAMLGVLLNLILGLSRVALAMGRRNDLPSGLSKVNADGTSPYVAVIAVGVLIAALTSIGDVKTTWSLSAFTVLVYYAITNLSAIRLSPSERLYPKPIPWIGLVACLSLAFWVESRIWITALAIIAVGFVVRMASKQFSGQRIEDSEDSGSAAG